MSKHYSKAKLHSVAAEVSAPAIVNRAERVFGLHPALFAITIGSYFLFLGIMATAFMTADLILPFTIFVVYVVMFFGTPGMWAQVRGRDAGPVQTWTQFRQEGMQIETGHIGSSAAMAQVVVLPILLVGWAIAIAAIAALL